MFQKITERRNTFTVASLLIFMSSVLAALIGYFYQLALARSLTPSDFGSLSALLSVLAVLGVPLGTYTLALTRKIAVLDAEFNPAKSEKVYKESVRKISIFSLCAFISIVLMANVFQSALKISDHNIILSFAFLFAAVVFSSVNASFLQGQQRFAVLALSNFVSPVTKSLFVLAAIWSGAGVSGALLGMAASIVVTTIMTKPDFKYASDNYIPVESQKISIGDMLPVFVGNLSFALMTQADVVLVKMLFSPSEAGLYAASAVLGKAIMLIPGSVVPVLFPMVANYSDKGGVSVFFFRAIIFVSALGWPITFLFYLYGPDLLFQLFGRGYLGIDDLIRGFGFAVMPMAYIMIAEYFLMASNKNLFSYLMLLFLPVEALVLLYKHDSVLDVLMVFGGGAWAVLAVGMLGWWGTIISKTKNEV